jgi:hypothetical protein
MVITVAQFSGICLQLLDLRLEPFDVLAQGVNRSLLQARLRLRREPVSRKHLEQMKEGVGPRL